MREIIGVMVKIGSIPITPLTYEKHIQQQFIKRI